MPPLPKNGPTVETTVLDLDPKGLDDSPVPSATSREEETAEATEEEPNPVAASKKAKQRRIRTAPSSSSSPAKDVDLEDESYRPFVATQAVFSSEGLSFKLDAFPTYIWWHRFWGTG